MTKLPVSDSFKERLDVLEEITPIVDTLIRCMFHIDWSCVDVFYEHDGYYARFTNHNEQYVYSVVESECHHCTGSSEYYCENCHSLEGISLELIEEIEL